MLCSYLTIQTSISVPTRQNGRVVLPPPRICKEALGFNSICGKPDRCRMCSQRAKDEMNNGKSQCMSVEMMKVCTRR